MSIENDLKTFFSRWETAAVLLLVLGTALGAATFLEAAAGAEAARAIVYNAWWFDLLLAMLVASFTGINIRMRLFARRKWGLLMLHYGFAVILCGALITHLWGFEGVMHIREGATSDRIVTPDRQVREVPFSVTLDRFTLSRYPGSQSPSSYQSDVTIRRGSETFTRQIYMNNIARIGGYRLYQSSYDRDERGTVFSVNYDPVGTAVSYAGYLMLCAGLVVSACSKGSRLRTLYSSLAKTASVAALWLVLAPQAHAAATAPHDILSRAAARPFGALAIQSPDGRIEPVDTYASELLRKLCHRDRYRGMDGTQVLCGILADPQSWSREPLIYIDSDELRQELGIRDGYLSFADMFHGEIPAGYRIRDRIGGIYAKAPADRSKPEKEYLKLDEKVNILYALLHGELFPLFPVPDQARWVSPGSLSGLPVQDSARIAELFSDFTQAVRSGDALQVSGAAGAIGRWQRNADPTIEPSVIRAEILYNRADIFRNAFRAYLLLGAALFGIALWSMAARRATLASRIVTTGIFAVFAFHTFGLGLRWYISGHAPWSNAYESMAYVGWATVLSGLVFARHSRLALALATLLGGVVLFVSNLNWLDPQITPLVPVLKSYWLMIHVSVITASYGFFGICAACGLTSLAATIAGRDLRELRTVNEMAMIVGLVLLTVGIFFGAVWANESWGRYWGWDPKETWALVTMLLYALVTHSRFIPRLNSPYAFDVMSVAAFASVLMTFFGVNYYLSGLHSYGSGGEFSPSALWAAAAAVVLLCSIAGIRYVKKKKTRE